MTMRKRTACFALAGAIAVGGLSGCLVTQKESKTYQSSTTTLRTIQAGDWITYSVSGLWQPISGGLINVSGRMRVEWRAYTTFDYPQDPGNFLPGILQEVTTLELDGIDAWETRRYVSQEPDGTVLVHGYEYPVTSPHKDYYLTSTNDSFPATAFEALPSPLSLTPPDDTLAVSYRVYDDCTAVNCATLVSTLSETLTVTSVNTTELRLNPGTFYASQLSYFGTLTPGSVTQPGELDMRAFCSQSDILAYGGTMNIFPEIGVIALFNTCSVAGGDTYQLNIRMTNTNIPLPPPT